MTKDLNKTTLKHDKNEPRNWFIFDASGKTLGRFASEIAKVLRGKHRPDFSPSINGGDGVIVLNAEKIRVTGSKRTQKVYRYYTGYMSGLREVPFETMQARNPTYIIENAVKGMLPDNRLKAELMKQLRVYKGSEHDMQAQKPIQVQI